jgi:hypothetical protein
MGRHTDGQAEMWTSEEIRIDRQTDGEEKEPTDRQMEGRMYRQLGRQVDRQTNGWRGRQMDGPPV